MASIRPAWALCTLSSALLILTGCDKLTHGDTEFARAALERNPDLTIVAADADAKTFTVQVKGSNEAARRAVDQIIGGGALEWSGAAKSTNRHRVPPLHRQMRPHR